MNIYFENKEKLGIPKSLLPPPPKKKSQVPKLPSPAHA